MALETLLTHPLEEVGWALLRSEVSRGFVGFMPLARILAQ